MFRQIFLTSYNDLFLYDRVIILGLWTAFILMLNKINLFQRKFCKYFFLVSFFFIALVDSFLDLFLSQINFSLPPELIKRIVIFLLVASLQFCNLIDPLKFDASSIKIHALKFVFILILGSLSIYLYPRASYFDSALKLWLFYFYLYIWKFY